MNSRLASIIQALCALLCLYAQIAVFSTSVVAGESETIVKMDDKTIFIPEIKLARKVNPVTSFLYIGSWEKGGQKKNILKPLCEIDSANNTILVHSPETLLENSKTRVVTRSNVDSFLDRISWSRRQSTHIAFKVMSDRRQSAVIEVFADSDVVLFHNGKQAGSVPASSALAAGGCGYLPVMLEKGVNIINIKQFSDGKPRLQVSVCLDHSQDFTAAWQPQGGLLKKLIIMPKGQADVPILEWSPCLDKFSVSLEVHDVSTNTIILQRETVRQGGISNDENANFPSGIYEAVYRFKDDTASEVFVVGNSREQFAKLQNDLLKYEIDRFTKPNIEALQRRAQHLLSERNYNIFDREWQEKLAYTLGCLASIKHRLDKGESVMIKDQAGLQVRGFVSKLDGSGQFYRLFVPSNYNPNTSLPLLVIIPTRIANRERPFIEGPVMANHREALLWAKYAEQYGFALLWPGYRGAPEGYSYESMHIDEVIQAVERDYVIDKSRISVLASCGAGYNAGRLVSEYPNRYAAIVYDRAVFDLKASNAEGALSVKEWLEAINPARQVLENRNLKIFVMHDDTKPSGHGEMELTTQFLAQAKTVRDDIVSYLDNQPMGVARMNMVFSWVAPCQNPHPDDIRSNIAAKAGYTGPISEIFTTPILIVKGTHATGRELQDMSTTARSVQDSYSKHFHDAECAIKNDDDVTQEDISGHSLILIGNPTCNSVWKKLQPDLAIRITPPGILYKNNSLTKNDAFEAIVRHPFATGKYILMIGASTIQSLQKITTTDNLFAAWYDCIIFSSPRTIIGKLDDMND